MIYTLDQLKDLVVPLAKEYKLKALWIFGSYARREATEESDVDILIDYTDSAVDTIFDFSRLNKQFREVTNKQVDLVSTDGLINTEFLYTKTKFRDKVYKERVLLYKEE